MRTQLLTLLLVLAAQSIAAQSTFTARIVDAETGDPLPLVSIYVSEEKGTLTNFDGEFSLVADSADLLRITCVGRESVNVRADALPAIVPMKMLASTLSEVTVKAVEGMLLQIARKAGKAFDRKRNKKAQYFYRQTSIISRKQDIVEAFIDARSAVNLRELEFLTGRHGRLTEASWSKSSINDMNLHHLLELGPMTREARFWHDLITPLPPDAPHGNTAMLIRVNGSELVIPSGAAAGRRLTGIEYLQTYYDITIEEMDGDDQQLYRIDMRRRDSVDTKVPIMTGTLYVDRPTLSILAFDGKVENLTLRFGQGELRSATTLPVTFDVRMDYRYDRKFPEVADMLMQARWGDFSTRTMVFNVEGQKHLRQKKGARAKENMLGSIATAGYDSTFWADNEVIKRTSEEAAIAAGTVERQQARLDSIAAVQAALPPLARMADRLARFGTAIPQEKVYVHLDNTAYFLGDTIWFAAYTRRTANDRPSHISRVLYCELWNHDGYLVERKLVEMKDGRGHGFFALPDTLYSGYFELRAYTRWQLNWGQTEHYHTWSTEYWFYNKAMAKDFFRDYEKLYSRVFPVYDKPAEAGHFDRDMTLRPLRRYFRTAPKPAELRLSLFPEGGNMVAGVPCRVAFEAATSEGEVRDGTLTVRERGKKRTAAEAPIAVATTENRGRGTFTFTPEEGKKYEVTFQESQGEESVAETIEDVKADGVSLQVVRDSLTGDWLFDIAAAGEASRQRLGLTVMHEGNLQFFQEFEASAPVQIHYTPGERQEGVSSSGIHQVTVFDSIGHVFADRLFFVMQPELTQPTLVFSGLKEQYKPFEQVEFDVTSAHLVPGQTVSLAVRDAALQDYTFDSGTILTEMLLASEIKGFVPQPEYFFEADDAEHRRALDLLMLTQGWRRFNWQEMAVKGTWEITHPAEHTQIVTGTVNRYYADIRGFNPSLDIVMADHEGFMSHNDAPLSEQDSPHFSDPQNYGATHSYSLHSYNDTGFSLYGDSHYSRNRSIGNPSYGWNLRKEDPLADRQDFAQTSSRLMPFQSQRPEWRNDDYNVLSFRTLKSYRSARRAKMNQTARQYVEEGNIPREVCVHAEFVSLDNEKDFIVGNATTTSGRFQLDLPRFEGKCVFHLAASDTTKWKKGQPHTWVQLDATDEYSSAPVFPEYYVRLNFPYPRWVKPYTFYQVHNAPIPANITPPTLTDSVRGGFPAAASPTSGRLTTDGTSLLREVTIRARHGGLRRIDYSKPAYVLDAYDALNIAMDAGLIDYTFSAQNIGRRAAMSLIGDMGMERHYSLQTIIDSKPGYNYGYLDQIRHNLLTYTDKFYIYTDYSPRREGDERFDQANQPSVQVDLHPYADGSQRVTYVNRRYILDGFAFQEDFYNPDYRRTPPTEATKDYRRTLYWNPELPLDANGRAHVSLFTGSRAASVTVDAAGQNADGSLLHSR